MTERQEQLIILLLGAVDRPIPTATHVQKEMFMFSLTHRKVAEDLSFQKYYLGAYSQILQELIEQPYHFGNAYVLDERGTHLTNEGKQIFAKTVQESKHDERFQIVLSSLKMIREIYDKLTGDELLFLMYATYPNYIDYSNVYRDLVKDRARVLRILDGLKKKGAITEDRYQELKAKKF